MANRIQWVNRRFARLRQHYGDSTTWTFSHFSPSMTLIVATSAHTAEYVTDQIGKVGDEP